MAEVYISIHALREEGDTFSTRFLNRCGKFLSTPSARRATYGDDEAQSITEFLSTPSARRATPSQPSLRRARTDFYPRPPRGGRRRVFVRPHVDVGISIHALREEGDGRPSQSTASSWTFLSTPSARRATSDGQLQRRELTISIHALREEGDPPIRRHGAGGDRFLSTPSARRATVFVVDRHYNAFISIHALREEGDPCSCQAQA